MATGPLRAVAVLPCARDFRPLDLSRMPVVVQQLSWPQHALDGVLAAYHTVWQDPHDPVLAPQAPWILECIAVIPEMRRRGVAKKLVEALLAVGKREGHRHAGISVTQAILRRSVPMKQSVSSSISRLAPTISMVTILAAQSIELRCNVGEQAAHTHKYEAGWDRDCAQLRYNSLHTRGA
jgi:GNAT superfamily N-acetyltransferase